MASKQRCPFFALPECPGGLITILSTLPSPPSLSLSSESDNSLYYHPSSSLIRSSLAAFLLLLPREPLSESKILLVSSFSLSISNISNNSIFKNKTVIKISPFAWQEKQLSSQPHVPCVGANHDRKSSLHLKVLLDGRIPSG